MALTEQALRDGQADALARAGDYEGLWGHVYSWYGSSGCGGVELMRIFFVDLGGRVRANTTES